MCVACGWLQSPGSFDAGVTGCSYVIHTASPFVLKVEDVDRDLLVPAVEGTRNVLRAAKRGTSRVS